LQKQLGVVGLCITKHWRTEKKLMRKRKSLSVKQTAIITVTGNERKPMNG